MRTLVLIFAMLAACSTTGAAIGRAVEADREAERAKVRAAYAAERRRPLDFERHGRLFTVRGVTQLDRVVLVSVGGPVELVLTTLATNPARVRLVLVAKNARPHYDTCHTLTIEHRGEARALTDATYAIEGAGAHAGVRRIVLESVGQPIGADVLEQLADEAGPPSLTVCADVFQLTGRHARRVRAFIDEARLEGTLQE